MRPNLILPLLGLLAGTATPAAGQEWIARVKSAPQEFQDRNFRIDGEVLELRGATAVSRQGFYRLFDGSDPTGVLIRTTDLPETSGPFQVTVKLAPELLYEGSLLLDEVRRQEPFVWQAVAPLVIAALGIVLLLLYSLRYGRARQRERHQHLAPPMWLIPTEKEGGTGSSDPGGGQLPAVRFNYRLQYIEQERSAAMERAKRTSLRGVAGAGAITLASMAWFLIGVEESTGQPTFVLLAPVFEALGPRPDSVSSEVPSDTATLTLAVPSAAGAPADTRPAPRPPARPAADPTPRSGLLAAARRDTSSQVTTGARQSTPVPATPAAQAPGQTPVQERPQSTATPPSTTPVRPEPAREDTAPREAPRDLAADRAAAAGLIASARDRLVSAINSKQIDGIATLFSWTGNDGWKNRFLSHLRVNESSAGPGALEEVVLGEGGVADASFGVTVRWRANFGVERRKVARFTGTVRRIGSEWRLTGIRLLQQFP